MFRLTGDYRKTEGLIAAGYRASADIVAAASNLQSHLTSNVSNISQRAAIAALTGDQSIVTEMKTAYARRRALMVADRNLESDQRILALE